MHMYDDGDEDEDDHMANGVNGSQDSIYEDGNDSQDEDMDDELLDKISSSPSIEDGKQPWPTRADSLRSEYSPSSRVVPTRGISFPRTLHVSGPPQLPSPKVSSVHHLSARHNGSRPSPSKEINCSNATTLSPTSDPPMLPASNSINDIRRYLLPLDDPFLDEPADENVDYVEYDDEDPDWIDEDADAENESSDDDQNDLTFTSDSRFIDSGWGGECLRELEDIDFEFVYALHTFVATVEGQANATKGDTMVLLDDSNSYWWLVRVVKDGSIGESGHPTSQTADNKTRLPSS